MKFKITPVRPGGYHLEIIQTKTCLEVIYTPRIRTGLDKFFKYKSRNIETTKKVETEDVRTISAENNMPKMGMPQLAEDGFGIYWEQEPVTASDLYSSQLAAEKAAEWYRDYVENYPKPSNPCNKRLTD